MIDIVRIRFDHKSQTYSYRAMSFAEALIDSASRGEQAGVESLVAQGADINTDAGAALRAALANNQILLAKKMYETLGAKLTVAFLAAVEATDVKMARQILSLDAKSHVVKTICKSTRGLRR